MKYVVKHQRNMQPFSLIYFLPVDVNPWIVYMNDASSSVHGFTAERLLEKKYQ